MTRGLWFTAALALAAVGHLAAATSSAPSSAQVRRIKRIAAAEGEAAFDVNELDAALLPALPEQAECEGALRAIAAAYGDASLDRLLHRDLPNRAEFLDALQRAGLRVSNLQMHVESIEGPRIAPWFAAAKDEDETYTHYTLTSDCTAAVRARLSFDGSTSGARRITEPLGGEWRVRFTETVSVPRGAR